MKKMMMTIVCFAVSTQLAFACPLHDGGSEKKVGAKKSAASGQAAE